MCGMEEDRIWIIDPDPPFDPRLYATGNGRYVRKPRVRKEPRPLLTGLVVLVMTLVGALVLAGSHWYALRPDPAKSGANAANVVVDLPSSLAQRERDCEYLAYDRKTKVDLPAPVDRAVARLVLQTEHGRLVVVLNGWAGPCAAKSVQSMAILHQLDRMQCIRMVASFALSCYTEAGYLYRPNLVDPRTLMASASARMSEDGTVHLVFPELTPRVQPVAKRRGLLTLSVNGDGYARGDLVLVYRDSTLPGIAYYPTVGEVVDEDGVLDRIDNGMKVLSATVE